MFVCVCCVSVCPCTCPCSTSAFCRTLFSCAPPQLLTRHIRSTLPALQRKVEERIEEVREQLERLGEGAPDSDSARGWVVLQLLNNFCNNFRGAIDGAPNSPSTERL